MRGTLSLSQREREESKTRTCPGGVHILIPEVLRYIWKLPTVQGVQSLGFHKSIIVSFPKLVLSLATTPIYFNAAKLVMNDK